MQVGGGPQRKHFSEKAVPLPVTSGSGREKLTEGGGLGSPLGFRFIVSLEDPSVTIGRWLTCILGFLIYQYRCVE